VSTLCDYSGIQRELFIETGMGGGDTLLEASRAFPWCVSVERNPVQYWRTVERFLHIPNVRLYLGDSPEFLSHFLQVNRRISDGATLPLEPFRYSVTFWLDAHTSDRKVVKQCPILEELDIITSVAWRVKPVILIDDAHFFDSTIRCCPDGYFPVCKVCDQDADRAQFPPVEELDRHLPGYRRSMRECRCQERFRGPDIIQYNPE
jgi:hypothetical protein